MGEIKRSMRLNTFRPLLIITSNLEPVTHALKWHIMGRDDGEWKADLYTTHWLSTVFSWSVVFFFLSLPEMKDLSLSKWDAKHHILKSRQQASLYMCFKFWVYVYIYVTLGVVNSLSHRVECRKQIVRNKHLCVRPYCEADLKYRQASLSEIHQDICFRLDLGVTWMSEFKLIWTSSRCQLQI